MKPPLLRCSLRAVFGAFCFLASLVLANGQDAKSSRSEQTKATITKSLNDFLAFNSDAAQHDRFWAEDLVYTSSAGLVKTKAEIMKGLADAAKPGATKTESRSTYSAEDILVRVDGKTAALTFRLVAKNADGTVLTYRNSGTLLQRKGQWQVITWQATKEPAPAK